MKRIGLFLGVEPHAGGMFQYAQSLLDALRMLPEDAYAVEVACAVPSWRPVLVAYEFPVTWLKAARLGLFLADATMAARLPGALTRAMSAIGNPLSWQVSRRCDLWIFPAQDAIGYQLRRPALVSVHDLMHRYEPHFPEVVKGRRFATREHRFNNLTRWAKAVLVDSGVGKTHVVESYGISPDKVYPLPYIPSRRIANGNAGANWFDERYRLPPKYLFYPAQFWAHKNHVRLIAAAAALRKRCPDIHLVFTGSLCHTYETVLAETQRLGMGDRVTFVGYVPDDDLAEFYRRARALVMPTFFGPTNIPPLEALACDCPVAVSRIYGMPEQLGEAALYFDPKSLDSIADALQQLWCDDLVCERLKRAGREKLSLWNERHFAARLHEILDIMLNHQPCLSANVLAISADVKD